MRKIAETIASLVRFYKDYLKKGILNDPNFIHTQTHAVSLVSTRV